MMPNKKSSTKHKVNHETTSKMANTKATTNNQAGDNSQQQHNQQQQQQQQTQNKDNILNVAEMLLHGVKDDEIMDIWLRSISCPEFVANFINAGYDMPTISRITPQDLTAIGITDPTKRLKILSEIKKLNLQDGIPSFKPASLSHWLSLIRLDNSYYKSLCDQQVDTIEKMCQLTWEDFEELGISKLGHQKRLQLAIERMKEIDANEKKTTKPMSEPIYDTNPSQILLVASAENHSMNGPIIAKQSSTSELSSTGSGSMHSVYSANSSHYQPTYGTIQNQQRSSDQLNSHQGAKHPNLQQPQPIYSQPPSQISANQQQIQQASTSPTVISNNIMSSPNQRQSLSHYQTMQSQIMPAPQVPQQQQQKLQPQHLSQQQGQQFHNVNNISSITNDNQSLMNSCGIVAGLGGNRNTMVPQPHRQSLGQLPFTALANLPMHQQQLLQQSSIYATLSRQPQRAKQPPPPVPIRTNSLKSNSLIDEPGSIHMNNKQPHQQGPHYQQQQQHLNDFHAISASSLFRSGTRVSSRNINNGNQANHNNITSQQFSSQTMLSKNKSFSGSAHMDAIRARFLMNRNSQHQLPNLPQHIQTLIDHNSSVMNSNNNSKQQLPHVQQQQQGSIIYGLQTNRQMNFGNNASFVNGHFSTPANEPIGGDNFYTRQSILSTIATPTHSTSLLGHNISQHSALDLQTSNQSQIAPKSHKQNIISPALGRDNVPGQNGEDYDLQSDTNSTKSLIIGGGGGGGVGGSGLSVSSAIESPIDRGNQHRLNDNSSQDSGSSQTLYNSASSGSCSNEHNPNNLHNNNFSPSSSRPADMISRLSTTSSSTLNDVNLALDQTTTATTTTNTATNSNFLNQQQQQQYHQRPNNLAATNSFSTTATSSSSSSSASSSSSSSSSSTTASSSSSPAVKNLPPASSGGLQTTTANNNINTTNPGGESCNATTGKDDDFPPPPSPLSLPDSDEPDLVSLNSDSNFTDISHGLMTFRVGT